ncbi:MAG: 6-carboxytetrahydropterin synthase [Myxococcales bacterium]|nr:6-carboxytetrahydropterin synthase [Myxococcales bacterium]
MTAAHYRSTKTFGDLPCAHRQHRHPGHCRFVHGYSRTVTLVFAARELDENQFVVDFSSLKALKAWLEEMFDHTLLINQDDPELEAFRQLDARGVVKLKVLPNVGMEATAKLVFDYADQLIRKQTGDRAWVERVEMRENAKNSAWYSPGSAYVST